MNRRRVSALFAATLVAIVGDVHPPVAQSHFANTIVFTHFDAGAHSRVVLIQPDGSNRQVIYRSTRVQEKPSWSPDKQWAVFISARTFSAGFEEIWKVRWDGSESQRLSRGQEEDYGWGSPAWSPNGRWIAAACHTPCDPRGIYLMDPGGRHRRRLRRTRNATTPTWSPDGTLLAFVRPPSYGKKDLELYVKTIGRARNRRLTRSRGDEYQPDWSPDGTRIVFVRTPEVRSLNPRPADLWIVNSDGTGLRRLTRTQVGEFCPAWSPNGRRIVFTTRRSLFMIHADGTRRRRIPNNKGGCPDW